MPSLKRPRAKEAASTAEGKTVSPKRWICSACTLENPARCRRCKACETRRPVIAASVAESAIDDAAAASSKGFVTTRSAPTQQSTVAEDKIEKDLSIKPARASRRNDTVSSTTKAKPRPNRKRKRPQSRPTSPNLLSIDAIQRDTMQHFTHLELLVRVKVQDAILPQPLYALYDDGDHVSDVKSDSGPQERMRVAVPVNNTCHKSKLLIDIEDSSTLRVRIKVMNEAFPELLPNLLAIDAIQRDTMQHFTQSECLVHVKVRNAILPQSLSAVFTIVADDHVSGVKCDSDSQETTRVNVPLNNNLHKSKLLNGFDESLTWRVRIKVQNESFPELLLAAIHAGDDEQPQLTIQPEISSATVKTTDCESEKNLYNNVVDFRETNALHTCTMSPHNDAQDCCESLACDPSIKEMIDGDTNEEPSKERVEQDEAFIRQPLLLPLTRMTRPRAAPQETKKDSEQLPILSQLPRAANVDPAGLALENTPRVETRLQMTPPASPTNKVHADATMCEKENYNRNLPGPSLARVKDASKVDSEVERKSLSSLTVDTKDKVFAESIKCKEESSHSNSPRQPSAAIDEASSVYPVGLASDNTLEAEEDSHLTQVASATDIFHADPTISDRESSHINLPCHTFAAPVQDLSSAGDTQLQPSTAESYSSQALTVSSDVNVEENIGSVVAALLDLSFEKRVPLDAGPIKFKSTTSEQEGAIPSTTIANNTSQSIETCINTQPIGISNRLQLATNGGPVSVKPTSGEREQAPDATAALHILTSVQRGEKAGSLLRESSIEAESGSSSSEARTKCSLLKRAEEESVVDNAHLHLEQEEPATYAPPTQDFDLSAQSPPTEMQRSRFFYTQASQSQQSLEDLIETPAIHQHSTAVKNVDLPSEAKRPQLSETEMSEILANQTRQLDRSLASVGEVMTATEHTDTQDVGPYRNNNNLNDIQRMSLTARPSPERERYCTLVACEQRLQSSNGIGSVAFHEIIQEQGAEDRPISSSLNFVTAGLAKAIKVTDESMAKAAALLSDGNGQSDVRSGIGTSTSGWKQRLAKSELEGGVEPANNRVTAPISSFTTAGLGKAITVSKESLSKAAHVLSGETLPPTFRLSFATAGLRKTITVSDESLHRAAELFIDRSRSEIVGAAGRGCANAELTSISNNMTDCEEAAKHRCHEVRCEAVADTSNAGLARMTAFAFVDSNKSDGKLGMTGTASLAPAFTTAGRGKTTSVSKESMATAALLLGGGNDIGQFDAHATTMPSFTTVERCKNSLTSDESMTKVTKLLSDVSSKDGHSSESFMPSFMTAGLGKTITVSDESMAKAERLLSAVVGMDSPSSASTLPTFKTAGLGKPISASDENMAEAAQLLSAGIDKDSLSSATTLPIFMTAGLGKTISASDESMAKAERLLSAVVGMDSPSSALTLPTFKTAGLGKSISVPDENMAEAVQLPFFTTAGLGKTISASDESMAKATKLLSAVSSKGTPLHAHATTMPAFTTAGLGKTISASDESMAKATKLLSAVSCKGTPLHAHATRMPAFTTAGLGKTISASAESMAKAAQLLAGTGSIDGHVYNNATLEPVSMSPRKKSMAMASWVQANNSEHVQEVATYAQAGSPIFATAGLGKRISVSHESIKKADQLFGGTEQCNGKSPWITAFATAGAGKAIQVSKNSMAKAQQLFEGDGNDTCLDKPFGTNMPADTIMGSGQLGTVECTTPAAGHHDIRCGAGDCPMFATAGLGKAISVSNESLDKATKLLTTERSASVECQKASMRRSDECDMIRKERETYGNSCTVLTSPARKYGPPSNDMCSANARSKPIPRVSLGEGYFEQHPGDQQASSPALPSRTRVSFETADLASRRRYDGQYVIREFEAHARDKTSFIDALRHGNFSDSSLAEHYGLHSCILIINSRNATNLRFDLETGFPAGFLASLSHHLRPLIGDTASYRNALLKLGCDCLMLTDNWIQNHVRWIIWKLASKERRFSRWLGGSYLTFSRVVEQLHHRFKKEIASGSRPVVRRILNRDVTAGCLMILCVADIRLHIEGSQESYLIELTDGWYPVRCWPADMHLVRLVGEGRIRVGSKLLLSSACLVGGENGVDPSDDDFDPFSAISPTLRISVNATRLARWNAKLGQISALSSHFSGCRNGMLHILKLSDVLEGGGSLPSIDLFVVKKFPLKYLLLHPEDPEGPSNLITEAEEAQRRMEYEKRRQVILDKFIDEIQQECEKDVDDKAPEIWHQYVSHDSPEEFYNGLPREQQREIEHWRDKRSTLLQKLVQGEATAKLEEHDLVFVPSKPFIRILVRSVISDSGDGSNEEAVLTIWDPCEEQLNVIKEGEQVTLTNVGVKAERFDGKLQLSASSRTSIVELSPSNSRPTRPKAVTEQSVTSIFRAQVISKSCPETTSVVDVTGIVINSNIPKQKVAASLYLTDQSGLLMRVECDTSGLVRQIASASNGHENEPSVCLQLHAVTLQSYDHIEGCAVVRFGNKSTVIQETQSAYAKELDRWSKSKEGKSSLDQQATRLKAGIWRHACEESCNKTAIGYITGFHFCGSTQDLLIYVDCGGNVMHVWKLHLSCLVDNESLWNLNGSVALDPATERNLAGLHRIAGFLRSRHKPYLFHLQRLDEPVDVPDCHYEVQRIDDLCTEALAEVYSRTLRSSLVLKEL